MGEYTKTLVVFGCGFLTSHLLPHICSMFDKIVLVDREKLESENYENYLFPKEYQGRIKVNGIASFLTMISPVEVYPMFMEIKSVDHIEKEIHDIFKPDLCLLGFDNVRSRMIVRDYSVKFRVPVISTAVSENNIIIQWVEKIPYPKTEKEISTIEEEMTRVKKVCNRREFRSLGMIAASLCYRAIDEFLERKKRIGYMVNTDKNVVRISLLG